MTSDNVDLAPFGYETPPSAPEARSGAAAFTKDEVASLTTPVRAWARYVAKLIDAALAGVVLLPVALVVGFLLGMTSFLHMRIAEFWASATEGEAARVFEYVFGLAVFGVFYPLFEGVCISNLGTTPGKLLLGIRLRDADTGRRLTMGKSISRSYAAYFLGLGASIPIVALGTQIWSYNSLLANDATLWDRRHHVLYETHEVSFVRWTIAVIVALIGVATSAALRQAEAKKA